MGGPSALCPAFVMLGLFNLSRSYGVVSYDFILLFPKDSCASSHELFFLPFIHPV